MLDQELDGELVLGLVLVLDEVSAKMLGGLLGVVLV